MIHRCHIFTNSNIGCTEKIEMILRYEKEKKRNGLKMFRFERREVGCTSKLRVL